MKWILPTFALCLFLMACGDKKAEETAAQETAAQDAAPAKDEPAAEDCEHQKGPYGGMLLLLGNNEGQLEVAANHAGGAVTVVSYTMEMVEVPMDKPPVLNFKSADGPKQLIAEGEDSEWIFFDDTLKKEFKQLRFKVVINGKTFTPIFDHVH